MRFVALIIVSLVLLGCSDDVVDTPTPTNSIGHCSENSISKYMRCPE